MRMLLTLIFLAASHVAGAQSVELPPQAKGLLDYGRGAVVVPSRGMGVVPYKPWESGSGGVTVQAASIAVDGLIDAWGRGYGGGHGIGEPNGGIAPDTLEGAPGLAASYECDIIGFPQKPWLPPEIYCYCIGHGVGGAGGGYGGNGQNGGGPFGGASAATPAGGYNGPGINGDGTTSPAVWLGSGGRGGDLGAPGGQAAGTNLTTCSGTSYLPGGGGGSAGGGVVRLIASQRITVSGTIDASGAGNAAEYPGHGSGGGILLMAPRVDVTGATIKSLGGAREPLNGGTVKIFADTIIGDLNAVVQAGRRLVSGYSDWVEQPQSILGGFMESDLAAGREGSFTMMLIAPGREFAELRANGEIFAVSLNAEGAGFFNGPQTTPDSSLAGTQLSFDYTFDGQWGLIRWPYLTILP